MTNASSDVKRVQSGESALETDVPELIIDLSTPDPPTLQIASDLHLEFHSHLQPEEQDTVFAQIIVPSAPVLALLGDIGIPTHPIYRRFLLQQAEQFEAVLVLAGNHEFYDVKAPGGEQQPPPGMSWSQFYAAQGSLKTSVQDMKAAIAAICAEHPRLHFADNTCVRFGKQPESSALLCSTLWSHIPDHAMGEVGLSLNDYHLIYTQLEESDDPGDVPRVPTRRVTAKDRRGSSVCTLTPSHTLKWHTEAVHWLRKEISRIQVSGCDCIGVLSHHAPSMRGTSDPSYETAGNLMNHGFASDLEELYEVSAVRFWAYGHTHFNNDQVVRGARLLSNQLGYEHEKVGYRPDFTIDMHKNMVAS